ncbi:MAG TPA: response regulator, partial [Patescibacteria group bacterium]|nr:response regulator [Patescibacteria group bacterium]
VGQGSVFRVEFPLQLAPPGVAALADTGIAEKQKDAALRGRVLLVEDNYPNVLVASTFLEEFGYAYDVASNGHSALEQLDGGAYDIILMDVQMPKMNGWDTTRAIRAREQENGRSRMPIIGMTAHALSGDRERCIEAGMDEYICKPFDAEELRLKLDTLLRASA